MSFVCTYKSFSGSTLPLNLRSLFNTPDRCISSVWLKVFRWVDSPIFLGIFFYIRTVNYYTKKRTLLIFSHLSFCGHFNFLRLYFFKNSLRFRAKFREKYEYFPYSAWTHTCIALSKSLTADTFVTNDEPTYMYHNHPKYIVHLSVHSW